MSRMLVKLTLFAAVLAAALPASGEDQSTADELVARETFFEARVRPLLAEHCFKCHGSQKASSELRVDGRESLLKGGDRGPAIMPSDPDASLLIQAVRHTHDDLQMPPKKRLADEEIAILVQWVHEGAVWPAAKPSRDAAGGKHWAFEPVRKTAPPDDPSGWAANDIDRFIAVEHRAHSLKPNQSADRRTLIRRAYFDLIGLPPSPEEVTAFVNDSSPDAWSKVVESLLVSPHYGERWGRHWMDVARYADTAGDNADYPIPEIALYRDYIIDAFQNDKPYDEFVREQIAGDILAAEGPVEQYAEKVIATGFLALSRRYATAPYELMHLTLEDTIDTVGRAFMGLTLRCARCHDHKFDPVTTEDYYSLYGIFASTRFPFAGAEEFASMHRPRLAFTPLVPPDVANPLMEHYAQSVAKLEEQVKQTEERHKTDTSVKAELDRLRAELTRLKRRGFPPELACAYAVSEGDVVATNVHLRGNPQEPGEPVERGVPKFLAGENSPAFPKDQSGRRELADWLTRPDHPLVARVMVNRIWQHHFGKGIVATTSNFGLSGAEPTHPALLDWLASEFVANGWSIKHLHRLILASNTYQVSSEFNEHNASADPANDWYWRFDRRRLDAEAIRDSVLSISGRLEWDRPGPHPFPPIEKWGWTQHNPFRDIYESRHRSVYLMTQRLQRHPYLALFDGPDTNTTTGERTSSTVPLQALYLMNGDFLHEEAAALGQRLIDFSGDRAERIRYAHELAYARPSTDEEVHRASQFIDEYRAALEQEGTPSEDIKRLAWQGYARTIFAANEFVYVD